MYEPRYLKSKFDVLAILGYDDIVSFFVEVVSTLG